MLYFSDLLSMHFGNSPDESCLVCMRCNIRLYKRNWVWPPTDNNLPFCNHCSACRMPYLYEICIYFSCLFVSLSCHDSYASACISSATHQKLFHIFWPIIVIYSCKFLLLQAFKHTVFYIVRVYRVTVVDCELLSSKVTCYHSGPAMP